jgi:protein SCO1/2
MRPGLKKILILSALLILPSALFYVMIYTGVHKVNRLKFYGPKAITESRKRGATVVDTVYHQIPSFIAERSDKSVYISDTVLNKTIYLFHFLDYRVLKDIPKEVVFCASEILPTFTELRFVTMVEHPDSSLQIPLPSSRTPKLAGFDNRWDVITGSDSLLNILKYDGYFKPDLSDSVIQDPYSLVLIDREGHIRGYYNPVKMKEISEMKKEILMLFKEYELAFKTNKYIDFNR